MFVLADRGNDEPYVISAIAPDRINNSTPAGEPPTGVADCLHRQLRAYKPFDEIDVVTREYVVHRNGEYANRDAHVNTRESHASPAGRWLSPSFTLSLTRL